MRRWAGLIKLVSESNGRLGNINPRRYQLGPFGDTVGIRDVTTGNNSFNGVTGFDAVPGYDQATGWGTADVTTLLDSWDVDLPTPTPSPTPSARPSPTPSATPSPTPTAPPSPAHTPSPTPTPSLKLQHRQSRRLLSISVACPKIAPAFRTMLRLLTPGQVR